VTTAQPVRYRINGFLVDAAAFQVTQDGSRVNLEPKALKVLVHLIEHRDRAVSKDELISTVWQGAFVSDNALTRVVAQLRKALQDDSRESRFIETVPTMGYRFIGPVTVVSPDSVGGPRAWRWISAAAAVTVLVPVLVWVARVRLKPQATRPAVESVVQFTDSKSLDTGAVFSPDGASIAYTSDESGQFEIYVRQMGAGTRPVQITADGGQNIQPAWSPDGRLIAYHSMRRGGIWVSPSLGGNARQLSAFGSQPVWSPDSSQVAFRSENVTSVDVFGTFPGRPSTLWVAPAGGGTAEQVTRVNTPKGRHGMPFWSPDGHWLGFVNHTKLLASELWLLSWKDRRLVKLQGDGSLHLNPVYAPDGSSIYYVGARSPDGFGLFRLTLTAGGQAAADPFPVELTGADVPLSLAIDPRGTRLAYSLSTLKNDLFALPLSPRTAEPAGPAHELTRDTSFRKLYPSFSPDASRIAYSVRKRGVETDIWLMNADGTGTRQITTNPASDRGSSWLPGGSALAYLSLRGATLGIYQISLENLQEKLLTMLPPGSFGAQLSPDGRDLVYHTDENGILNLRKKSMEDGKETRLTFDKEGIGYPVWSPDGRFIAFEILREDATHLAVMPGGGGPYTQVTRDRGHHWPYSWGPDSSRVATASLVDGCWNLWWMSPPTGKRLQLTHYTSPSQYVRYPAWSPKGDQIVYEYSITAGNVFVMTLRP
jgi:Tol biopolymer transport system component/DNA-binding winged helix-turn-helix (wHTH) protein